MKNILLVDDEILSLNELRDAVVEVLGEERVIAFNKPMEALDYIKFNKIEIAFLDVNMRLINGIEMSKKILELHPKCNIVFCTGHERYAIEALKIFCSGYLLKPVSIEDIKVVMKHLRYPLSKGKRIKINCFGNFDVFCDGIPIAFKYKKTRELLAYLVDRNGAEATTREIMASIFEKDKESYFGNIRLDLLNTFNKLGVSNVIMAKYGRMRIMRDEVDCDYFDYLDGGDEKEYRGEYMVQYSFAEFTQGRLNNK